MNIEIIGWLVAWIIVTEVIFIYRIKKEGKKDWKWQKIISMWFSILFLVIQWCITIISNTFETAWTRNYENLAIEVLIILGIYLFFKVNKLIVDKIK